MDKNLFEASLTGNVQVLNALLQKDPLILDRISLTSFNETPLHIASLRGHLDFVKILVHEKPTLVTSLDSQRRTPLHVACAEGHVEIVRELLSVMSPDVVRFRDQDGRTALHLAAMNEQLEVIKVLIESKPELGKELTQNGDTILHECISSNRFEAFKLLCRVWNEEELAKLTDRNGNTLLHLAVALKHIQTVKYLLEKSTIRENQNIVNGHGLTALDLLNLGPRDYGVLEIQSLLMEADTLRAKDDRHPQTSTKLESLQNVTDPESKPKGWMSRLWHWYLNDNGNWLEKQRGVLILATIVVAAISYYSGIHPPGGTFSDSDSGPLGNAVQTEVDMDNFNIYLVQNTIILVISLLILVVLLCGIPLRNKFVLWVLNLATLGIMFFMTVTYLQEIAQMSPDSWVNHPTAIMCFTLMILCLFFAFIHTVFFIIWIITRLSKARATRRNDNLVNV